MNWTGKDINTYVNERDYIDTVIIPLVPIAFDASMKRAAEQGEFISLLSMHVERQFKGRILVLPALTYVDDPEEKITDLKKWEEQAREGGFAHVFFLTADERWKKVSDHMNRSLFYLPSIPLEHMEEQYKHSIMEKQLNLLMDDIIEGWQNRE